MIPQNSTNLKNRVNKLYLPKTKPLYALFEVISNSIHAIQEKKQSLGSSFEGKILINTIRNGDEEVLKALTDIEKYPINSFRVIDNGIGLDDENFKSFEEFDSEKKAEIGGKGIGRLICIKTFKKLEYCSVYKEKDNFYIRKFDYKKSKDGFENYGDEIKTNRKETETSVILSVYVDAPAKLTTLRRFILTTLRRWSLTTSSL